MLPVSSHCRINKKRTLKIILTYLPVWGYCSQLKQYRTQGTLMRKINTRDFHVATRTTSRDINRHIALNLIREHQPISRADLARGMKMTRGVVSVLVQELIAQGLIYEGATGEAARGRKPTFLHIKTY